MPTYNSNILPTTTGVDLGSTAQRFDANLQDVDIAGNLTIAGSTLIGSAVVPPATIQAAIDAAYASGGGRVLLQPDTTYTEAITLKSNVTLEGVNSGSLITIANSTNAHVITIADGATNVAIKNLKIDGNASGQSGSWYGIRGGNTVNGLLVDNVEVTNTRANGLRVDAQSDGSNSSSKINVRNCYFHDNGTNDIWILEKCDGLSITNNRFSGWGTINSTADCISLSASANDRITNVSIVNNDFNASVTTLFAIEGVREIVNLTVSNNRFQGNYSGISLQAKNGVISNNVWTGGIGSHRSGLEIALVGGAVVGNIIPNGAIALANADAYSVTSAHVTIAGNVVASNAADQFIMNLGGLTGPINDVAIIGNSFDASACTGTNTGAIFLGNYGTTGQITNIRVMGNRLVGRGSGVGGNRGIRIATTAGSTGIVIESNSITAFNDGIFIPAGTNLDEVTILSNDLRGNGTAVNNSGTGTFRVFGSITADDQTTMDYGSPTSVAVNDGTAPSDLTLGFAGLGTSSGKSGFFRSSDGSMNWCIDGVIRAKFFRSASGTATPLGFLTLGTADSGNNYGAQGYPQWQYSYWDGAAAQTGTVTMTVNPGSGSNPLATINLAHAGSSGGSRLAVPRLDVSTTSFFTGLSSFTGGVKTTTDSTIVEATSNNATWTLGSASELLTLSTVGLTTDTSANLLPANSIIESVVCRVTTTITTTTNWAVGDATQSARFSSANATLVAGTTSVGLNHQDPTVATANLGPVQTSTAKVRITCTGSNPGAGVVRITVFYRQFVAPTS